MDHILGGFAPGKYMCRCSRCKLQFMGDKRSFECFPCAKERTERVAAQEKTMTITIPPEALEAAAIADFAADMNISLAIAEQRWAVLTLGAKNRRIKRARAACLAMLRNWPHSRYLYDWQKQPRDILLPLQEKSND